MKTIAISIQNFERELQHTFTAEDYKTLADTYRKKMDTETATEMFCSISESYNKQAANDTQFAKNLNEAPLFEKLLNVMIEAFVRGAVYASEVTAEAMTRHAVEVLEKHAEA